MQRPEGLSAESRASCGVIEVDPPRRLRYLWPGVGDVCFEQRLRGEYEALLTSR